MNCKDFTRNHALALATISFVPLATLGNLSLPAKGADYQQPFPDLVPTYDKVDFASGWYVRGDIAYAQESFPAITPTLGLTPSVLNSYSAGAGMGYKVNDWLRTDLVLDYRSQVQAAGIGNPRGCAIVLRDPVTGGNTQLIDSCIGHFNTEIHRWDLLANAYIDIGTWQGFTPYVGAGAGVSWARIFQSVNWTLVNGLPCQANCGFTTNGSNFYFIDWDRNQSSMTYRFAWALMAGVAVAVADHVQLDVGYRFLDLGSVSGISSVTGTPITQNVRVNEVRGGLRYMID
jgi:opacity protein-like surface antigen